MERIDKATLGHIWTLLLVVGWLAVVVGWVVSRSDQAPEDTGRLIEYPSSDIELASVEGEPLRALFTRDSTTAVVFVSESCQVCVDKHDQIVTAISRLDTDRRLIVSIDDGPKTREYMSLFESPPQILLLLDQGLESIGLTAVPAFVLESGQGAFIAGHRGVPPDSVLESWNVLVRQTGQPPTGQRVSE